MEQFLKKLFSLSLSPAHAARKQGVRMRRPTPRPTPKTQPHTHLRLERTHHIYREHILQKPQTHSPNGATPKPAPLKLPYTPKYTRPHTLRKASGGESPSSRSLRQIMFTLGLLLASLLPAGRRTKRLEFTQRHATEIEEFYAR